jgi:PAS domain S-box-containing protein
MSLNIAKKREKLLPLIDIDTDKCINCHACIHVCPVKFCNSGAGSFIEIDHDLCIGCGACIRRCTHGARGYVDDMEAFVHHGMIAGKKTVAVLAPSVVANFGDDSLRLNGWLCEACGVEAVFDASFGAELTVKSYVEYLKDKKPGCVIAQPCPAIVSYIELYLPDLIPHLAPIDSPMVHTMKMIREFFPQYADCQIVAITPCLAKKREFAATHVGDYSVSFRSIKQYLHGNKIELASFSPVEYVNPAPERAVSFSTPGGLLNTLERWMPGIREQTRRIEGPRLYEYLSNLPQALEDGTAPLLIDCLSCEFGCNGGTLSEAPVNTCLDQTESRLEKRRGDLTREHLRQAAADGDRDYSAFLDAAFSPFWKENLYERRYCNRSANNHLDVPSEEALQKIYLKMGKQSTKELFNCNACGYERCEHMAIAVHNGLNKPENCHYFLADTIAENDGRLRNLFTTTTAGMCVVDTDLVIHFVNDALCTLFGTTKDRLLGTALLKAQFEAYLASERPVVEFRIKRSNGTTGNFLFHASQYAHQTPLGERKGYFAMITEIQHMPAATPAAQLGQT